LQVQVLGSVGMWMAMQLLHARTVLVLLRVRA
jgi:hypothetical protein